MSKQLSSCSDLWLHGCGVPKGIDPSDGMSQEECDQVCRGLVGGTNRYHGCNLYPSENLTPPMVGFECYSCIEGRRPEGWVDSTMEPTIAGWLAHAADLERVSIDAFQILRRELADHGAPAALLERVAMAEADEVRHTSMLGALAMRAGAMLSSTPVRHGDVRSLLAIALENAVEGCVRETYGALVAAWQSEHAERNDIRRVMKQIHRDETEHAELAWSVHVWLLERLDEQERSFVEEAMRAAVAELATSARVGLGGELTGALGLPPAREAVHMVEILDAMLWAAPLAA